MKKSSIHLSFLFFNGPFALAIASKKSPQPSSFFKGKYLAKIGSKLKEKTAYLKDVLPDVISLNLRDPDLIAKHDTLEKDRDRNGGAYKDRLSISLFLSEFKERTGDLSQMIADRLLSKESAMAVKRVRQIIENFPDHGVLDVFSLYPTKDVVASILALSRLQRAALYGIENLTVDEPSRGGIDFLSAALKLPTSSDSEDSSGDIVNNERDLLEDLAHYSAYAHCAYGWKFGLLSGRLHLGDTRMLKRKTGVKKEHILSANRKSKTHLPAHFLVQDVNKKKIVLCIRGTLSPKDFLTDLCCTAEEFATHEEEVREAMGETASTVDLFRSSFRPRYKASAHHGMLESARGVALSTRRLIASELASKPDYDLVIVGHSLGGGVAAILGSMWRDTFPGVQVYAFGCPCVGPINAHPFESNDCITCVVGEGDPFSCLSLGHLADASLALSTLCEDETLREAILNNTNADVEDLDESQLKWCIHTLEKLESKLQAEKFYPPGRVLYMKGNLFGGIDEVSLNEIKQESTFRSLRFHPRMFDLSLHIPHRYEVLLSRIGTNDKQRSQ